MGCLEEVPNAKKKKCVFCALWDESVDQLVDQKVIRLDTVASNLDYNAHVDQLWVFRLDAVAAI